MSTNNYWWSPGAWLVTWCLTLLIYSSSDALKKDDSQNTLNIFLVLLLHSESHYTHELYKDDPGRSKWETSADISICDQNGNLETSDKTFIWRSQHSEECLDRHMLRGALALHTIQLQLLIQTVRNLETPYTNPYILLQNWSPPPLVVLGKWLFANFSTNTFIQHRVPAKYSYLIIYLKRWTRSHEQQG